MFENIYRHNFQYARTNNEVEAYRRSLAYNVECRNAIEQAIRLNYNGCTVDTTSAADHLIHCWGLDRVVYVLANTIQDKDWDGRFSHENKNWANQFTIGQKENGSCSHHFRFIVASHPGLTDQLATEIRKRYIAEVCKEVQV